MSDTVNVIGVRADGSSDVLGTSPTPPAMKRREIASEMFGALSQDESGNEADCCLWALEHYHVWLVAQGWKDPALVVTPLSGQQKGE